MNQKPIPLGRPNALIQQERNNVPWIWEGVIALGAITLLSAPDNTGKTTLLSLLLDRRRAGGQFLGRTVWPGKTIVCTEENHRLWSLRQPPLDFGPDVVFRAKMQRVRRRRPSAVLQPECQALLVAAVKPSGTTVARSA